MDVKFKLFSIYRGLMRILNLLKCTKIKDLLGEHSLKSTKYTRLTLYCCCLSLVLGL